MLVVATIISESIWLSFIIVILLISMIMITIIVMMMMMMTTQSRDPRTTAKQRSEDNG